MSLPLGTDDSPSPASPACIPACVNRRSAGAARAIAQPRPAAAAPGRALE